MMTKSYPGGFPIITVTGDLTRETLAELSAALHPLAEDPNCQGVVLNITDVAVIDSAGLGVLIHAFRRLRDRGCSMAICNARPFVRRAFAITCLDKIFPIADSVAEGLALLSGSALSSPPSLSSPSPASVSERRSPCSTRP